MKKFIFATDLHFGFERRNGHKIPLHDMKAFNCMLAFAKDFKPDVFIVGGDFLDCGVISHHNHGKPGAVEGLKLIEDARALRKAAIEPIESIVGKSGELVYIIANHEDWLTDLTDKIPALEGLIELKPLLNLSDQWKIIPQGGAYKLGKLTFVHGDTIKGGEHVAKNAVVNYERSIRFGHHHTMQQYSKASALDYKNAKSGWAIPCLCTKSPKYGEGAPNRWVQGFNFGYIHEGGYFNDYVAVILDGRTFVHGKKYQG